MNQEKLHTPEFWASFRHSAQRDSILRQTQLEHPERWRRFYDEVANIWEPVTGSTASGEVVAGLLAAGESGFLKGKKVIDIGCGSGPLSLALAGKGAQVTAVDDSSGMIELLNRRVAAAEFPDRGGIRTKVCSWTTIEEPGGFDLSVAAFFPPAWEPEGVSRLERLSFGDCALVLPAGADVFPLRTALWSAIMKPKVPGRSALLLYLFNYLHTLGRRPDVKHFSPRAQLDVDFETAVFFYVRYFSLLGHGGADVEETIRTILRSFARSGRIQAEGKSKAVLLKWKVERS